MKPEHSISRSALAGGAALTAAAAWRIQSAHHRRIASDPAARTLAAMPSGRAVPVRGADGTLIHAEVFGRDGAPTIVFAHGWTEALRLWVHQIQELSGDFRVVAYDQRGHGRSGRPDRGGYTLEAIGDDLEAVLETCVPAGERAVVVGHSMGAMTIAAWAARYDVEERIRAAALVNTGMSSLIDHSLILNIPSARLDALIRQPFGRYVFLGNRGPLPHISTPLNHAVVRHLAFGPTATPAMVEFMLGMVFQCPTESRAGFGIAMGNMDLDRALARITVPTLVMAGADDRLTPPVHAYRMASQLPDLDGLIVHERTGHMGPLERPDEYSEALRDLALNTPRSSKIAVAA